MRRALSLLFGAAAGLSAVRAGAQPAPTDPTADYEARYVRAYLARYGGTERRSTGMMVTGIVLTGLGAMTMGLGTGVYFKSSTCDAPPILPTRGLEGAGAASSACPGADLSLQRAHAAGMSVLVAGSITAALGIPLWIVGGSSVSKEETARSRAILVVGARAASISWQF